MSSLSFRGDSAPIALLLIFSGVYGGTLPIPWQFGVLATIYTIYHQRRFWYSRLCASTGAAYIMALQPENSALISIGAHKPSLVPSAQPLLVKQAAEFISPNPFFFCFYFALILFSLDKPSFFIHGQVVLTQPQLLRGVLMMFFHRVLRWIQYLGDMSWWETQWNYWGNSSIWGTLKCVIPFLTELPKYYWFYYPHIFDSKKFKALLYFPQIRFISSMTELIN